MAESHKITWLTLKNMRIDIKTDDFAHFWDFVTLSSSPRLLILVLGNCRLGQNWSILNSKNFLPKNSKFWVNSSHFQLLWSSVTQKLHEVCDYIQVRNCLGNFIQWANHWAKHQWICFGWGSSREPPIDPKFFFGLLTPYTHLFILFEFSSQG